MVGVYSFSKPQGKKKSLGITFVLHKNPVPASKFVRQSVYAAEVPKHAMLFVALWQSNIKTEHQGLNS